MTQSHTVYHADRAWLSPETGVVADAAIAVRDGRIDAITLGQPPAPDAVRLPGFVMPGLVNSHSHVFHRALRGRTHAGLGDFWSWREQMYSVLEHLTVDRYRELATATYAEMVLAGITTVVEFHYLRRDAAGTSTGDPSSMDLALMDAARLAGIDLVLLNTCYLQADVDGTPLNPAQTQFSDGDVDAFLSRMEALRTASNRPNHLGVALHSVRGCPPEAMRRVAEWATAHDMPLHIHLSEQVRENQACLAVHGRTPTQLCADTGVLGPRTTAVHATHLTPDDIRLLGESGTIAGFCPTTERDLADGIGPSTALRAAGSPLSLGSDSHAVIDLFEEARAVELNERLATMRRGHHRAADLLAAGTAGGAASAGLAESIGRIAVGFDADLIAVDTDSVRLSGAEDPVAATVFAATAADVTHVVGKGRLVVSERRHVGLGDVGAALRAAIAPL